MYHTVQLIICAFIIKRREMLINCNPLTFYWCAQICNIHKLQPIRIPNSSSTVFISILFLYTAHNALPFYNRDWFIACFRDRHLLIMTRRIIVERIKRNHKNVYKPSWLPTKGCNYSTSYRGKPDPWFKPFLWRVEYFRTGNMKDRLWLQFNIFLVFVYWNVYFWALQ